MARRRETGGTDTTVTTSAMTAILKDAAARRWLGNTIARAYKDLASWRTAALLFAASQAVSALMIGYLALAENRVVPYVALTDRYGREYPLERAPAQVTQPAQHILHWRIVEWLKMIRPISNDRTVFDSNWGDAQDQMTLTGWRELEAFYADQQARQEAGRRVQIKVGQVQPIQRSNQSYTVTWLEYAYDHNGVLLPEESGHWAATVRIADFQTKAAQREVDLRRQQRNFRNLLGVFIDGVHWDVKPLMQPIKPIEEAIP